MTNRYILKQNYLQFTYLPRLKATAAIYMDNKKNSMCWWDIRPMSLKAVRKSETQIQGKQVMVLVFDSFFYYLQV